MAKKMSKHYPVVRKAPVSSGPAANTLVDTGRFLSVLNRRLYRMGRNYEAKVDLRNDYAGQVEVYVLRDDWVVQKAYQMAYQAYLDNTMEEREGATGTNVARWEDFRVQSGLTLALNTGLPVMHSAAGAAVVQNEGEFTNSHVVDDANVQRTFTWGTPGGTQFGILTEYDKAGNAQGNPSTPSNTAPYSGIDGEHNDQTAQDLANDNNQPPYDRDGINGDSPWVRVAVLGATAGTQKLSSGYFCAPCGFVLLKGYSETSEAYSASLEVKSGDYKGVHAPSMIEVATVNRKRKVVK